MQRFSFKLYFYFLFFVFCLESEKFIHYYSLYFVLDFALTNTDNLFDVEVDNDLNDKDWIPSPTYSNDSNESDGVDEAAVASTVAAIFEPLPRMNEYIDIFFPLV